MGKQEKIKLELLNEIKKLKEANRILKNQKEFAQTNKLNFDSSHLFFMKSPLPMWVYDKHTYFVLDVNKAACEIYDYSREEFLKMNILDFRPKKDKEQLLADLKKPRPEKSFSKGWRHQFRNGQVIDVEILSQELNYGGKEAVMLVANDITSEEEHKNRAKQSEKKFRLITSHSKDAIILIDDKGYVTLWNPAAEKIFGFTHEEVIGKDLHSFIMPRRYGEQMKKGFSHFIKSGQGPLIGNVIEIEALHKSGHEFPISISLTAFKLNNEWNATATIRDITEEKTAQQKLLQSEVKEKKRADELILANKELVFQNKEKQKRADELAIANRELAFQNREKEKRADELILANKELAFQKKLDVYRSEMESVAHDLTRLIDTANAPIFGIDSTGLVNEWNQTSEKITGFKKEEVRGKDLVGTYITEDYREAVKQVLDNALKGKETANYEFPLFTKDGRRVMVLLNSSSRRDADGKIIGVLGVGQDISELDAYRTRTEAIAKELRQFIETANAPIFGIDEYGKVNEWNQTSEKITGFKKDEVLGKNLVETYITEDYRKAVKQVLDNALKGKETANYEFPLFTKDGRRVMVLLNSSTRRNADGKIIGVLGVGQDISELDNYKSNLENTVKSRTFELVNSLEREKELGKLKTSFVAMASHEFRTPLAAIQAATDVILRYKDKLSQEDIEKRLFKIKREVSDMTTMLEDILIIGKADSQKLQFNAIELDLVDLVKNIILEYQLTEEKEREVVYKRSMDKIMMHADPKWIKHIVINLFSNALKYSEPPASVSIEIRQEKNEVVLSVSDKGIGISKKDQKTLFEPFSRGENVGNIAGTGLGLTVLEKAVTLHKGHIEVFSKLNKGTEVRISLPAKN
jgi:PAS domain S-box-containing protein